MSSPVCEHLTHLRPGQRITRAVLARAGITISTWSELPPCAAALVVFDTDGVPIRRRWTPEERSAAVIDLSNMAWTARHRASDAPLSLSHLPALVMALRSFGVGAVHAVADANLPHIASDWEVWSAWTSRDAHVTVEVVPGGTTADDVLLTRAEERGCLVVSNDMFRSWRRTRPWRRHSLWRLRLPVNAVPHEPWWDFGTYRAELASQ